MVPKNSIREGGSSADRQINHHFCLMWSEPEYRNSLGLEPGPSSRAGDY